MPNFNADGYLSAGIHDMTLDQIEQEFVVDFTSSTTRADIFDGYRSHSAELAALGPVFEEFIDGSFTTSKTDPGDIDLVCFALADEIDNLSDANKLAFKALVSGKITRATHHCDAYFCAVVPETDPLFDQTRPQRKYWMGEFGFDRQDKPKGIVRTAVGPEEKP
jgi:hypothetical protein